MKIEVGNYLEVAGKLVGRIEMVAENTLLVRKIHPSYPERTVFLMPEAVFLNKDLIESSYWTRVISSSSLSVSETIDLNTGHSLVSEFLNV